MGEGFVFVLSDSEARGWGKPSGQDGAVYIPVGETSDTLAEASCGELCTHEARVGPQTNRHTAAHN